MYSGSFVTHLEKRKPYHLPLVLSIKTHITTPNKRRLKCRFRFEEMWTREEACEEAVKEARRSGENIIGNIARMTSELREWSKNKFGDFAKEMRNCKGRTGKLIEEEPTVESLAQMRAIDGRMEELERREEIFLETAKSARLVKVQEQKFEVFSYESKTTSSSE